MKKLNNIIQEVYVSFEVAKLLKEKGFDEPCRTYYQDGKFVDIVCTQFYQWNSKSLFGQISAPTHQMVMAWLREIHGIFIAINNDDLDFNWQCYNLINRDDALDPRILSESYAGYKTYEEAVEAALKFSLKNLI